MLPTFVIGLREGLEAALIVGIVAAFLAQQGRRDALRQVWVGVGAAVAICLAIGVALQVISQDLPQRQQEGLETVIGLIAVAMVTYMVVWMRRHSRDLKGDLEHATSDALAAGSAKALVLMAFLAVLREGFETAVFLLATFQHSSRPLLGGVGALLGLATAVVIGLLIYRGGVHLNLSRFFRVTGLVLVVIAAGLVMASFHTAHEAGWLDAGQAQVADLTWLVRPGTPLSSLLTGVLGIQAQPAVIEVVAWFAYLVPLVLFVAWPQRRAARAPAAGSGAPSGPRPRWWPSSWCSCRGAPAAPARTRPRATRAAPRSRSRSPPRAVHRPRRRSRPVRCTWPSPTPTPAR